MKSITGVVSTRAKYTKTIARMIGQIYTIGDINGLGKYIIKTRMSVCPMEILGYPYPINSFNHYNILRNYSKLWNQQDGTTKIRY